MSRFFRRAAGRLGFWFARTSLGGALVGLYFGVACPLLPAERLGETEYVVAFHHPRPSYPVHVLIVPKKRIPHFLALTAETMPYAEHALLMAQQLVRKLKLEDTGYRFLVNGGMYQDVKQVHFHLVSGTPTD